MSAIRPSCLFALAALMATPAIYADGLKGDAAAGKALFMSSSCPTCHAVIKDDTSKVGPNLVGVVGRQAGTKKSLLGPSENMKKYGVIWHADGWDPARPATARRRHRLPFHAEGVTGSLGRLTLSGPTAVWGDSRAK